jgi:hypothetical protein
MEEQSYKNHAKLVPAFHFVLLPGLMLVFLASLVNLYFSFSADRTGHFNAALITLLSLFAVIHAFITRVFPLKAQDRAIRAEEALRHYVLTGTRLDPRLKIPQIIGLRFAPDDEFPTLARRAMDENLTLDQIKQAIGNWRADHDRL